MEIEIVRQDDRFQFEATSRDQAVYVTAKPELAGGEATGFRPMELLLNALGSCMAIDVLNILYKQRQPVEAFEVQVHGERDEKPPTSFKKISIRFVVSGEVEEKRLERAIQLSFDTYCSVRHSLDPNIHITTEYFLNHGR